MFSEPLHTMVVLASFHYCNKIPKTVKLERGKVVLAHSFEGFCSQLVTYPIVRLIMVGSLGEGSPPSWKLRYPRKGLDSTLSCEDKPS